jgi:predicted transcriptional regulator of viral defense system
MAIDVQLQRRIPREEFDYQTLLDALNAYSRPRDKITDLLRKGVIVRVKKGLYIFGPDYSRRPYSRELLANLIYGPSYLSLDYALSYYGLIPEKVETLTSVTSGKTRTFQTPVGRFTYQSVPLSYYRTGIDVIVAAGDRSFLMATREKALADRIRRKDASAVHTVTEMESFLVEHLRVDSHLLWQLDAVVMAEIAESSTIRQLFLLSDFLKLRAGVRP